MVNVTKINLVQTIHGVTLAGIAKGLYVSVMQHAAAASANGKSHVLNLLLRGLTIHIVLFSPRISTDLERETVVSSSAITSMAPESIPPTQQQIVREQRKRTSKIRKALKIRPTMEHLNF
ncbi:3-hydroxyisobutyrate dehydrogenase [Culex quinquefasciatus]|uniref:3-hydroxyisobutyrate dehydrogenase n=1 Tax=Culex quinquefasciatus TaxID=7176 RepID=B0XCK6_CULQU|nr:3-hydroxyisobutyrate dehydrogenase [Culex quinquefasciatus]|eukprot:XP_001867378.1 3-hydroxyisobutyrate dehydrogenase [Culex quinquefasciatus]